MQCIISHLIYLRRKVALNHYSFMLDVIELEDTVELHFYIWHAFVLYRKELQYTFLDSYQSLIQSSTVLLSKHFLWPVGRKEGYIRAIYMRKITHGLPKLWLTFKAQTGPFIRARVTLDIDARCLYKWFMAYLWLMPHFCVGCQSNRRNVSYISCGLL